MLTAPTHLITPDEPSYDDARVAWNLAIDQRPAAVVVANSVQDVQEAIGYARANDLRVAAQSTGHGAFRPWAPGWTRPSSCARRA